ncbi:hypothetical protein Ancab_028327 [Ancistrocladus abbreviatus]
MNRVLCKSGSPDKGQHHLTPRQIWEFIEHIGVRDKTNLEEVVRRIDDMEQRDWAMFQQMAAAGLGAFSFLLLFWVCGVCGALTGVFSFGHSRSHLNPHLRPPKTSPLLAASIFSRIADWYAGDAAAGVCYCPKCSISSTSVNLNGIEHENILISRSSLICRRIPGSPPPSSAAPPLLPPQLAHSSITNFMDEVFPFPSSIDLKLQVY